jgi:hypothetical protein
MLCFFSVIFSFYFGNGGMMDYVVNRRNGHQSARKDVIPLAERFKHQ